MGYRTMPLNSMYRDSKYITPYTAPYTNIYLINFIDFCVVYRVNINIQQYVAIFLHFNKIHTNT